MRMGMRAKLVVLFVAIGAISFFFGLGTQQSSDARLGSSDLKLSFGFAESGEIKQCTDSRGCIGNEICIDGLCIDLGPPMNFTITNISNDPVELNFVFVGIDRDLTTKQIEGYPFPLKEFLQAGESLILLFDLIDLEGEPLALPEKKFQLIAEADKFEENTRDVDKSKIKEIKVKKSFKFK